MYENIASGEAAVEELILKGVTTIDFIEFDTFMEYSQMNNNQVVTKNMNDLIMKKSEAFVPKTEESSRKFERGQMNEATGN